MPFHRMESVAQYLTGGYRARCLCRWTSGRYARPEMARSSFVRHQRRMENLVHTVRYDPTGRPSCSCGWTGLASTGGAEAITAVLKHVAEQAT